MHMLLSELHSLHYVSIIPFHHFCYEYLLYLPTYLKCYVIKNTRAFPTVVGQVIPSKSE